MKTVYIVVVKRLEAPHAVLSIENYFVRALVFIISVKIIHISLENITQKYITLKITF